MSKRRQSYKSQNPQPTTHAEAPKAIKKGGQKSWSAMLTGGNASMWWLAFIPALSVLGFVAFAISHYPHSETMMEKLSFFINTPEYIKSSLAIYPGVNSLSAVWLLQFFKESASGIVIESIMLGLIALLAGLVPSAWKMKSNILFAVIPPIGISWCFFHRFTLAIEGVYFFMALCAVGLAWRSRKQWVAAIAVVLAGLTSFWMLSFPIATAMLVSLSVLFALKYFVGKDKIDAENKAEKVMALVNVVLPLVFIPLTVLFVKLSSEHLSFIPLNSRWWYTRDVGEDELLYVSFYAVTMVLLLLPRLGGRIVQIVLTVLASIIPCWIYSKHVINNEGYQTSETMYKYSDLADAAQWQDLLQAINEKGEITDNVTLQFALLAESRMGTLPENLFTYPINNPETFCPRLDNQPLSVDFCRMFYREMGFYDEAFHQTFEFGMMTSPTTGFCMKSLRNMAEYSVKLGDKPLAEKYLWLLDRTNNNGEFVAQQREQLKGVVPKQDTLRANNFVKAFAFNSEMAHFIDLNHNDSTAVEYLLCGLLLTKQLELFKTVINDYAEWYQGKPLPRAFAEAASMINHIQPGILDPRLTYDSEIDRNFEAFMNARNAKQDIISYKGTFWLYYTDAQIPPPQSWQQFATGSSTS